MDHMYVKLYTVYECVIIYDLLMNRDQLFHFDWFCSAFNLNMFFLKIMNYSKFYSDHDKLQNLICKEKVICYWSIRFGILYTINKCSRYSYWMHLHLWPRHFVYLQNSENVSIFGSKVLFNYLKISRNLAKCVNLWVVNLWAISVFTYNMFVTIDTLCSNYSAIITNWI